MAIPSGLAGQIGFVSETQFGLPNTVTKFVPFVDESLAREIERLESEGIIAGARLLRSEQWRPGIHTVGGDIGLELFQQGLGTLFRHMFGAVTSSTTAGVSTHTFTPGDLTGQSMTIQVGRPTVAGTVIPFTYAGCKVNSWELALATDENATLGLTILGQSETTGIGLAVASFGTNAARPFSFIDGAVSIASSTLCVREITIGGENGLTDERRCIGQAFIDQPLEAELRRYEGTATIEFTSTQQYERFTAGTEAAIVLSLSASATAQVTVTMNARFDGVTPNVEGPDLLVQEVPYVCVATGADSTGITAVMRCSETSV